MTNSLNDLPRKKALEWSLVLLSMKIPHRLRTEDGRSLIDVDEEFMEEAASQIRLYEEENAEEKKKDESPAAKYPSPILPVLAVFTALFIFQTILYQTQNYDLWLKLGNSSNLEIKNGEFWRVFTAMTLHADLAHFLSNAFMGGVVFYSLFSIYGSGIGLFLAVISGAAGNSAAAMFIPVEYHSIGASGAVFGAFGILAIDRMIRPRGRLKRPDWKPVIAALAFLGLFGTSGGSDIIGHLMSLLSGLLIGLVSAVLTSEKYPGLPFRIFFACLSIALITGSWMRAVL